MDPQLEKLLQYLEKFGFRFLGLNESKTPLVTAPNGQIVSVDAAYNFVQKKLSQPAGTGGPEKMPLINQNFNIIPGGEVRPERGPELNVEKAKENSPERAGERGPQSQQAQVRTATPIKKEEKKKKSVPIPVGVGFLPRAFDPTDLDKVQNFIFESSKKDNATPEKWVATLWEKFLLELAEEGSK